MSQLMSSSPTTIIIRDKRLIGSKFDAWEMFGSRKLILRSCLQENHLVHDDISYGHKRLSHRDSIMKTIPEVCFPCRLASVAV